MQILAQFMRQETTSTEDISLRDDQILYVKVLPTEEHTIIDAHQNVEITKTMAAAMLIDNPLSKITGNIFLGINTCVCPVRLVTTESEAINWFKKICADE